MPQNNTARSGRIRSGTVRPAAASTWALVGLRRLDAGLFTTFRVASAGLSQGAEARRGIRPCGATASDSLHPLSCRLVRTSRSDPLLCPTLHVGVDCLNLLGAQCSLECGHSSMEASLTHNLAEFFGRVYGTPGSQR